MVRIRQRLVHIWLPLNIFIYLFFLRTTSNRYVLILVSTIHAVLKCERMSNLVRTKFNKIGFTPADDGAYTMRI